MAAAPMQKHQDAVRRLIEIPGIGATAAPEILAEIGPDAATFPSSEQFNLPPGSVSAPAPRRAPGKIIPAAPPKAIVSCAGCSVRPRKLVGSAASFAGTLRLMPACRFSLKWRTGAPR